MHTFCYSHLVAHAAYSFQTSPHPNCNPIWLITLPPLPLLSLLPLQEEVDRDPDLTVLWTTKDWEAWPRGISKAAARVLCDPLFFFTVFAPWWIMAFNVAWPHKVAHQTIRQRVMYVAAKLVFIPCLYTAVIRFIGMTTTHLLVSVCRQRVCGGEGVQGGAGREGWNEFCHQLVPR
jgi:hypothetical protein